MMLQEVKLQLMNYCKIGDCFKPSYRKGFCTNHYSKLRNYGDPLKSGNIRKREHNEFCSINDCNEKYFAKDLCKRHYNIQPYIKKKDCEASRKWKLRNLDRVVINNTRYLEKIGRILNLTSSQYNFAINIWAKIVKYRDNNKCVICGSIENLNAHHIIYRKDYPELSLNVNNGITLCVDNHNEVHGKCLND